MFILFQSLSLFFLVVSKIFKSAIFFFPFLFFSALVSESLCTINFTFLGDHFACRGWSFYLTKNSGDCTTVATQPRQLHYSNNLSQKEEKKKIVRPKAEGGGLCCHLPIVLVSVLKDKGTLACKDAPDFWGKRPNSRKGGDSNLALLSQLYPFYRKHYAAKPREKISILFLFL